VIFSNSSILEHSRENGDDDDEEEEDRKKMTRLRTSPIHFSMDSNM